MLLAWVLSGTTFQAPYRSERYKIAEEARKAAGTEKKKRKFIIEERYDDCGADPGGLGPDVVAHATDYMAMPSRLDKLEDSEG